MSAATAEASSLIQSSCTTAAQGVVEYNAKLFQIACANTNAAFEYARELDERRHGGSIQPHSEQLHDGCPGRRGIQRQAFPDRLRQYQCGFRVCPRAR